MLRDIVSAALEKEANANAPADLHDHSLVGERAAGQAAGKLAHRGGRRQAFGRNNPLEEVHAEILFSLPLGYFSVIISHITFTFPFVLIGMQARLQGMDPSLEEAALDLGATPFQAFFKVILPYLVPAIASGALLAFSLSLDDYIVTVFVTGAASQTLPLKVYGMVRVGLNPQLNALSALGIVLTMFLVFVSERLKQPTLGETK